MRLIDADEYKGKVICNHLYSGVTRLIDVNSVPTAFDLESVIKQLEEKSKWVAYNNWDRDIGMTHKAVPFGEIVDILKSAANATNGKNGG